MSEKPINPLRQRMLENMSQGRRCRVAVSNCPLHLSGAPDGIDDARKLRQHPVAGVFHDPAAVLVDFRVN